MKISFHLFLVLSLSISFACVTGCEDSNEPINVVAGKSKEELDAQADAISAEYEQLSQESMTAPPTAEERAANAGR